MSQTLECPYCGPTCVIGFGLCHCGCGATTNIIDSRRSGVIGAPFQYLQGHRHRAKMNRMLEERSAKALRECYYCGPTCVVGPGMCHCGCGEPTNIAAHTEARSIQGVPTKCLHLHHDRGRALTDEQAAEIRRRYLNREANEAQLAKDYGVVQTTISNVLLFETYKEAGVASGE